jgi:hypothetical protein
LGTNAQFFPAPGVTAFSPEGILRLNQISGRTLVGYVMGGIESPLPNINRIDPALSVASGRVFAVYVDPAPVAVQAPSVQPPLTLDLAGLPAGAQLDVRLTLDAPAFLRLDLIDLHGRTLAHLHAGESTTGAHRLLYDMSGYAAGLYYLRARANGYMRVVQFSHR